MNSRRLVPLQTLADQREDEAARRLADVQRRHADQEARLVELRRYADEYANAPAGPTAVLMLNRQAFLGRLREAERFQVQAVEDARLAVEAERAAWLLKRRDVSVLDQLAACYRGREQRQDERREQRGADELALRRFAAAQDSLP
ncbi:flagellar export protein FliJ [Solimonas sp. SE-A11]|uniref:flagellar export protein FliJ n=1 Tax=Solimonas sp. SE-A11 TaxID=3054954 RepID=UPI00259CF89C|nr:flagellar export protein FliJ [Solimonas sp. SE-A11]MDM4770805.1 flagellar export protein FliJ [Solimonas sp. SE-A11]